MNADLDSWLAEVGQSAFGEPPSLRFTYDKTRELLAARVPGDLLECGVAAGVHPATMAKACEDAGEARTVRLFDSFEGIPMGGRNDRDWNEHYGDGTGALVSSGVTVCPLPDVQANLERWLPGCAVPIVVHPGWFENTLPALARTFVEYGASIAFLRIDCDLYEGTKACLTSLYPLVSPGGVCVVDDLNLDGCREAVREYMIGQKLGDQEWRAITASGDAWTMKQ